MDKKEKFIRFDIQLTPEEASYYTAFMSGTEVENIINKNLHTVIPPIKLTHNDFKLLDNKLNGNNVFDVTYTIPYSKIFNIELLD